jgi:hypothetical protein
MANRAAGLWTAAAMAEAKRQQRTIVSEMVKAATGKKPKRATRRPARARK